MTRSSFKKSYHHPSIIKKIFKFKLNKLIKGRLLFARSSTTPTSLLEFNTYMVYNGQMFSKVSGSSELNQKKLGEFSITRRPFFFPKKDKKKR